MDWQNLPVDWDLKVFYDGLDDPRIEADVKTYTDVITAFAQKWREDKSFLTDADKLFAALEEFEQINAQYGELTPAFYVYLASRLQLDNAELKGKQEKLAEIERSVFDKVRFFFLELGKVAATKQQKFLSHPKLQKYKHFLERSFATAKYDLSDAEERVVMEMISPARGAWGKMREQLLSAEVVEFDHPVDGLKKVNYVQLLDLLNDTNKAVRDAAAAQVHQIMSKFAPTMEHELNAVLQTRKALDKLRGYEFAAQHRHIADDIETETVKALQQAVTESFEIAKEYYELKAKLLKQDKLRYHERNVPVILAGEEKKYTYPQAIELVHDTFAELDAEFAKAVVDFAEQGRIDVYPKANRYGNAFCVHGSKSQPIFVFLNHSDQLQDVLTLAHEMGHAINDLFMQKTQHSLSYGSPLATAEVASTFMEDFVLERLLEDATPQKQLEIQMAKLNDDISTIIRQIACYNFEEELHEQFGEIGYLSKEQIGELFRKHMSAYMGDFVTQDEGAQNWWVYWGHIRSYFYNYSYASGLLISKALQAKVKKDKAAIEQVKFFLSAGTSQSPAEIFREIGINITEPDFWLQGMQEVKGSLAKAKQLAEELKLV